jgi:deoxyadenosine/deoxycytidine kinase
LHSDQFKVVFPGNTFMKSNYSKIENDKFNCQLFFLARHFFHKSHFLDQHQL